MIADDEYMVRGESRGTNVGDNYIYTTQLAHLFLCGTSGWAINRVSYDKNPIAFGTFTFLLGHGLLGLCKYTMDDESKNKIRPAYRYSTFITRVLPLPLLNTQIYLSLGYSDLVSYAHAASIAIPTIAYVFKLHITNPMVTITMISNAGSLAYLSITNENYWTLGFSIFALLNEITIDFISEIFESVPPVDLWITGLGMTSIAATSALKNV